MVQDEKLVLQNPWCNALECRHQKLNPKRKHDPNLTWFYCLEQKGGFSCQIPFLENFLDTRIAKWASSWERACSQENPNFQPLSFGLVQVREAVILIRLVHALYCVWKLPDGIE